MVNVNYMLFIKIIFFIVNTYIRTYGKHKGILSNLWLTLTISSLYHWYINKMTLPTAMKLKPGPKSGKGGHIHLSSITTTIGFGHGNLILLIVMSFIYY